MIDEATLRRLWPRAPITLVADTAARADAVFAKYNINTPLRVAHFMAQISHESNGGTITEESLNYTHASRIAAVWPSRFTEASAADYVGKPRELANKVYNGRMGTSSALTMAGTTEAGDFCRSRARKAIA
jgi:putative chitinase